jgi:hypothetical protein
MNPGSHGRDMWTVADFNNFLKSRANVDVGTVAEPSILHNPIAVATILILFASAGYGGWKIYTSSWIGHPWIWTTLVLAVFMFATSGERPHSHVP